MTVDEFLAAISCRPPAERVALIDGALWGQSVDPTRTEDELRRYRTARL